MENRREKEDLGEGREEEGWLWFAGKERWE